MDTEEMRSLTKPYTILETTATKLKTQPETSRTDSLIQPKCDCKHLIRFRPTIFFILFVQFFQDGHNVTTFVLSGKHEHRWVGIGFSRDGHMVGSSAVVAWVEKDGVSGIRQYYLEGKNMSKVIPDKGDLRFTTASPVVLLHDDLLYVAFQLKFDNSLAFQPILLAIGSANPLKNGLLPKHINSTTTYIEFSSGFPQFFLSTKQFSKNLSQKLVV